MSEPENSVWFYNEYQQTFTELQAGLPNISFVEGMSSSLDEYLVLNRPNIQQAKVLLNL